MKREDLIIVILGLLLLAGILLTVIFGGEKSRHGVGIFHDIHLDYLTVSENRLRLV